MIFRPVRPVSAFGPPISNRPVGLTRMRAPSASSSNSRSTGSITSERTSGASRVSTSTSSRCCALISTVSTRLAVVPSYAIVTWLLPSGRRYGITPALRTSASRLANLCAIAIGSGISSSVSPQAYPNIIPWSPAPSASSSSSDPPSRCSSASSTPRAMSGDCSWIDVITPQVSPSIPKLASVYPISVTVRRTTAGISMYSDVEISPATMTSPVVTNVSHATRHSGSTARMASRTASEIRSASLSGCPSVTDSDENRYAWLIAGEHSSDPRRPSHVVRDRSGRVTTARALDGEQLGEAVANRGRELGLGPLAHADVLAVGGQDRGAIRIRTEPRAFTPYLVRHQELHALAPQLLAPGRLDVFGLGREAHEDGVPGRAELGEDVTGGDEADLRRTLVLLDLCVGRGLGPEIGDGRRHHDRVGPLGGVEHGTAHLVRGGHAHHGGTGGGLDRAGTHHERDRGPASERLRGDGEPHLARRTVPHESNGVDRLPRRSGRHDDACAGEIARCRERILDRLQDAVGLGHAARPFVAGGQRPVRRSDDASPSRRQGVHVCLRRRVLPHPRVHRRREDERAAGLEQRRSEQIVRDALRELGDHVRRGRRDDGDVGLVGEPDMQDDARLLPQVGVDAVIRERRERRRADEPFRRTGHHDPDGGALQAEEPHQDARLVGGDPTGDAEEHATAPKDGAEGGALGRHAGLLRPPTFRRRGSIGYLMPTPSGRSALIFPSAISSSAIDRGLFRNPVSTNGGTNSARPSPSWL